MQKTGVQPTEFRKSVDYKNRDLFLQDLLELLELHYAEQHALPFYAEKMHVSVKVLSRKVKDKLNMTLGQFIRNKLIQVANQMLLDDSSIKDISFRLGFEESNHFSSFYKHYTGITPSQFRLKKCN